MSRTFEGNMTRLSEQTGYEYDLLVDRYNEVMEEDGAVEFFFAVTLERDW